MRALIAVNDLMARSRLVDAAERAGFEVAPGRSFDPSEAVDLVVADLDQAGVLDSLGRWRPEHPGVRVIGFAFHVNQDVLERGRTLGIEVLPHGATLSPSRLFS